MWLLSLLSLAAAAPYAAHEWGTFTAVAGEDGTASVWRPRSGPSDLPSFVYDVERQYAGTRQWVRGKGDPATIRMETPVIYFHTDEVLEVEVAVDFPMGQVTEWYPSVASWTPHRVDWGKIKVLPYAAGPDPFPREAAASHYYPAREVKAGTVQVCDRDGLEQERFLFYRGVGDFDLSLVATVDAGGVSLRSPEGDLGRVMLFERQGDRIGSAWTTVGAAPTTLARPALTGNKAAVMADLGARLRAEGLHADEVAAMLKTWDDQWFEDGLRVFYVLPTAQTEAVLPLHLSPPPDERVRVLVARVELFSPEALAEAARIVGKQQGDAAAAALAPRFGRFAEPLAARLD